MYRTIACLAITLGFATSIWSSDVPIQPKVQGAARRRALPLYFIENQGQTAQPVRYYLHGRDTAAYFTGDGMVVSLTPRMSKSGATHQVKALPEVPAQRWAVKLEFVGARIAAEPQGVDKTEAIVSYFKGSKEQWKVGLPTYASVRYRNLWPGIDLVWEGKDGQLKSNFIVRPGADPSRIRLRWRGAKGVRISSQGAMEVGTPVGSLTEGRPCSYQHIDGQEISRRMKEVSTGYWVDGEEYGFQLGDYDRGQELVIDPVMLWYAGYIGGGDQDYTLGIAVDRVGNSYVTGHTWSTETTFPVTVGPDLTYNGGNDATGGTDAFVAKVNANGTALVYAGFIGGAKVDFGRGIAVDTSGNAYVTGETMSEEDTFPVAVGPSLIHSGGAITGLAYNAFVAKLNATGTGLVYAGYIAGSSDKRSYAIAVDTSDNAYVAGDDFVAKVDASGTALAYTYTFGGPWGRTIAVDSAGSAYVATASNVVTKLNTSGTASVYTFPVGTASINGLAVDAAGNAYLTGSAASGDLPTTMVGPDLTYNGGAHDAFVAKVNATGTALVYAGYIGGSGDDAGRSIALDTAGNGCVTGSTDSTEASFPVAVGPDLTYNGGAHDAFVAKVNLAGTALLYAGYIGGSDDDTGWGIAVDWADDVYVAGWTKSIQTTFPVAVGRVKYFV